MSKREVKMYVSVCAILLSLFLIFLFVIGINGVDGIAAQTSQWF